MVSWSLSLLYSIMKKILTLLAILFSTLTISAQNDVSTWGYYMGNDLGNDANINCIGTQVAMDYVVMMKVPNDGLMQNAKITGINLPVHVASALSKVSVFVMDTDMATLLTEKTIDEKELKNLAFTTIMLDTPVTVDHDIYVGTKFKISNVSSTGEKRPVLFDQSQPNIDGGLWMYYNQQWNDLSQYGCYVMQIIAEDMNLSPAEAVFGSLKDHTNANANCTVNFPVLSNSKQEIKDFDYTISINGGDAEEHHATASIPAGYHKQGTLSINYKTPTEVGPYTIALSLKKINGVENIYADSISTSYFDNVDRSVTRNVVMEEYTGTDAGLALRGNVGIRHAEKAYKDRFIGIALHRFNDTDPMYLGSYDSKLTFSSAPRCYLDRQQELDPYYGDFGDDGTEYSPGKILNYVEERMNAWAPAAVSATASFNDKLTKVNVTAEIDALTEANYKVVYVVTVNNLYNNAWIQQNDYSKYEAEQWNAQFDSEFAKYFQNGEYGKTPLNIAFDNVAVASSYVTGSNRGGTAKMTANSKKEMTYTLNMPTSAKAALQEACQKSADQTYAIVMLVDEDGKIANACKVKVELPAGIESVTVDDTDSAIEGVYSLDGRRLNHQASGITIIRMKDGSSRKVFK